MSLPPRDRQFLSRLVGHEASVGRRENTTTSAQARSSLRRSLSRALRRLETAGGILSREGLDGRLEEKRLVGPVHDEDLRGGSRRECRLRGDTCRPPPDRPAVRDSTPPAGTASRFLRPGPRSICTRTTRRSPAASVTSAETGRRSCAPGDQLAMLRVSPQLATTDIDVELVCPQAPAWTSDGSPHCSRATRGR